MKTKKTCIECNVEVEELFAPFNEGPKLYCSNCQLECESARHEEDELNYLAEDY